MRRALTAGCLLLLAAGRARAQSCWPVAVLLEVRDADGARIDPAELDSIATIPVRRGPDGRGRVPPARVSAPFTPAPASHDPAHLLEWSHSGCRVQVDEATLYRGEEAMRLVFGVALDSERPGSPYVVVVEAPPFRSGAFRLRWDPAAVLAMEADPPRLEAGHWAPIAPAEGP